ncbi:MAG: hypothetical protein MI749_11035, partial [Desulfovibrionales bacterium]|nr:hypothetical protein [Desulfovibrionales bacterium]
VGIVAGIILFVVAGWLWLGGEEPTDPLDIPEITELEQPSVPAYEEYAERDNDTDVDDQSGDVTRIIIHEHAKADNVDLDEVLAGKVIIDGQVVLKPGE